MRPPRGAFLAAIGSLCLAACSKPSAFEGEWTQVGAGSGEILYLNTSYDSNSAPIIAETLDIWRVHDESETTILTRDKRAFWCTEQEVQWLERWTSRDGAPLEKRELSVDMARRRSVHEFDVPSGSMGSRPNAVEGLLRKVCGRFAGERIGDPVTHFESLVD